MIKVLINSRAQGGVDKYRVSQPHHLLQELFPDEFEITYNGNDLSNNLDYIKEFNIIFFHKLPIVNGNPVEYITNIKKLGVKVIIDIDDYWNLNVTHGSYEQMFQYRIPYWIQLCLSVADLVTVTTEYFANEIKTNSINPINSKVIVIPNGINPNEEQFISKPTNSDLLRIGWLGGSSHYEDLKLLNNLCQQNIKDTQTVLCGFDIRGEVHNINVKTGKSYTTPIKPKDSIWVKFEKIMSNNYKRLSKDYVEYLQQYEFNPDYNDKSNSYRRIWTKDINHYAEGYNELDVVLSPLQDNLFNRCKSELKVIESLYHKKAVIASNIAPYQIINHKKNGLVCEKQSDWTKNVMYLKNNPNAIIDFGEQLYEDYNLKYNLIEITKLRREVYKQLINN